MKNSSQSLQQIIYGFSVCQIKQELNQRQDKVEHWKFTALKNCIFTPFVDTNGLYDEKTMQLSSSVKAILKSMIGEICLVPTLGVYYCPGPTECHIFQESP